MLLKCGIVERVRYTSIIKRKEGRSLYRVDLDLDREQVKQLKQLALDRDTSVRGLVTQLVIHEIETSQKDKKQKEEHKK